MPVLATFFSVRRGRDPFFKFFMKTIFPRQIKEYEEKFGIRFLGWYNVAYGWDFDNVTFVLNVLDGLAGDDRFIEIRKRKPVYRTLTAIEEATSDVRADAADAPA